MITTLAAALEERGYHELTPVQTEVSKPEFENADLLVSAQTGSGKTVGFGLAIAPTLLGEDERFGRAGAPLALIIAPTRELALQVKRELAWLYQKAGAVVTSCVGGMDMRSERRALDKGAHVVVATPGRLCDHIRRGSLATDQLRAIVLDEADEMLDLGFREDLEFILGEAPEERRTLMFSATVPRAIATLAKKYQRDAHRITTTAEQAQHTDIEYRAMSVGPRDIENAVINVLRFYEAQNALVFCNTRAAVNRLTTRFSNRGFSVVALSGELTQNERTHALQAMRDGRARVCVATDVAARGIDLPKLDLVIHADLPSNSETLLHRSGRTGRAGRKGVSALIVPVKFTRKAERLLQGAKVLAEWAPPPSASDVMARDEERLLSDPVWDKDVTESESEFVAKLVGLHGAEKIAAAYLRLHAERMSAPEELTKVAALEPGKHKERPVRVHSQFGPSVWFSVSVGRSKNVAPRWMLPLLCRVGNISSDEIGAIRIQQDHSYIEILAASADKFQEAVGPEMTLETGAVLKRLDAAPDLGAESRGSKPPHRDKKPYEKRDKKPYEKRGEKSESKPYAKRDDKPYAKRDDKPYAKRGDKSDDKPYAKRDAKPYEKRDDKPYAKRDDKPYAKRDDKPYAKRDDKPYAKRGAKPHEKRDDKGDAKPYAKRVDKGDDKPYTKRDDKPYAKRGEGGDARPFVKRGDKGDAKPYAKRDDKREGKSEDNPFSKPGFKPKARPSGKPAGKSAGKPAGKPSGKPAGKPYGKSAGKPTGKPFGKSTGKPSGKPAGKPSTPRSRARTDRVGLKSWSKPDT